MPAVNSTSNKLAALKRDVERLKKMNRAKTLVLSILAHNALPSLFYMKSISENSLGRWDDMTDEELKKCANLMSDSSNSLYDLSQSILEWTRSQKGFSTTKRKSISILGLVQDELLFFRGQLDSKELQFEIDIERRLKISSVPAVMRLIIQNILSNAIKYSEKGKSIFIRAEKDNGQLSISIRDEGVGIHEDKLHHLQSKTEVITTRGTNDEQGFGLGLLMVEDFLAQLGGEMIIDSELNKGTTVTLLFVN